MRMNLLEGCKRHKGYKDGNLVELSTIVDDVLKVVFKENGSVSPEEIEKDAMEYYHKNISIPEKFKPFLDGLADKILKEKGERQ
jgi:hypothetical protein